MAQLSGRKLLSCSSLAKPALQEQQLFGRKLLRGSPAARSLRAPSATKLAPLPGPRALVIGTGPTTRHVLAEGK